jgi:hypothetical protein
MFTAYRCGQDGKGICENIAGYEFHLQYLYTITMFSYLEAVVIVRGCCGCRSLLWGSGSESEAHVKAASVCTCVKLECRSASGYS